MTQGTETVRSFIESIKAGDHAGALEHLTPGIVVSQPPGLPWSGEFRGTDGFQELLGKVFAAAEISIDDYTVTGCDGMVVLRLTVTFTARATGAATQARVVELYEFDDGRISSVDVYHHQHPGALANLFSRPALADLAVGDP